MNAKHLRPGELGVALPRVAENAAFVNVELAVSDGALLHDEYGWSEQVDRGCVNEAGVCTSLAGYELSLAAICGLVPNAKVLHEADVLAQAIGDGEVDGLHRFGL